VSDIDTAVADGLKVLDLKRPIREGDMHLFIPLHMLQKPFRIVAWQPTDRGLEFVER
jgi:hypothetical protein